MKKYLYMTQVCDASDSGGTSAMSNFTNASTMTFALDGYASTTMPNITNPLIQQSFVISAPYIQGGFIDLLL